MGQKEWKGSIKVLTGNPVLVIVLRGIDCSKRVKKIVHEDLPEGKRVGLANERYKASQFLGQRFTRRDILTQHLYELLYRFMYVLRMYTCIHAHAYIVYIRM